ncbi:uncharacterized protein [Diabrotica undecimpunctata]|uniref:uncharacterized protein n=1 Tax=Diabrotica undecimpunctata TaxID=50387 RepID=UPI003B63B96E
MGNYGKKCNSSIFKDSTLCNNVESNTLDLLEEQCLPGTDNPKLPYFFIGDEAFGLHKHLMRPYGGTHLTLQERIFNYRARRYVKCAFGILTNKWRVFYRSLNVDPDFAVEIIKACVVLHNFIRDRDGYLPDEIIKVIGLKDLPRGGTGRGGIPANSARNILSKYFLSEVRAVPWQMNKI